MSDCNIHSWSSTNPDKECPQCRQLMIGREWEQDSRLEKWFPITAEELKRLQERLQSKSEDLAAANAEIARLNDRISELNMHQSLQDAATAAVMERAGAAERERDALRNRCQDAEEIILRGVELLGDRTGEWAGVRAWLEQDTQHYIDAAMGKDK